MTFTDPKKSSDAIPPMTTVEDRIERMADYHAHFADMPQHQISHARALEILASFGNYDPQLVDRFK